MKADSWQVRALWLYLHGVMLRQLEDLGEEKMRAFRRIIDQSLESRECEALEKILRTRDGLEGSEREILLKDYGAAGKSPQHARTVSSIHRSSAVPHWWGVFLFRLVRELKPRNILELGTNLGVSAAYIQSALNLNGNDCRLITIEGDPTLAAIARETIDSVANGKGEVVLGRFQDMLTPILERMKTVDLVFIDGHHEYEPTLEYFERIKPSLSGDAAVVFDDIYLWSRPVRRAWKEIVRRHPQSFSVDLAKFGILVWR